MKNKIGKSLATAGLLALAAIGTQILGINTQTMNAMINEDGSGQTPTGDSSQKSAEKMVVIKPDNANDYIKNGEVKIADGTTEVIVCVKAFQNNESIKSMVFPDSVKKITFSERCFKNSGIENLKLPPDMEKITFRQESFRYTEKLTSPLVFGDVAAVSFEEGAFANSCVPSVNFTKSVDNLYFGEASFCYSNIDSLNIPEGTKIDSVATSAFSFTNLKKVDFSKIDTPETFVFCQYAFASSSIGELKLPNAKNIRFESRSFNSIKDLGELNIPGSVKNMTFGVDSFSYSSISNVNIPAGAKVDTIDIGAFRQTKNLQKFDLSEIAPTDTFIFSQEAFSGSKIREIKLPKAKNICFGPGSFNATENLGELNIPGCVKSITFGVKSFNGSSILNVNIPVGAKVNAIETRAFRKTENLQKFDLSETAPADTFTFHEEAFLNSKVKELKLPNAKNIRFGKSSFCNTTLLNNLSIPESVRQTVFESQSFYNSGIKSLKFLSTDDYREAEGIPVGGSQITFKERSFFSLAGHVDEIQFPKNLYNLTFEEGAFGNLPSLDLSQTHITKLDIPEEAFLGSSMKKLSLPPCLRNLTIAREALSYSEISQISFPNGNGLESLGVAEKALFMCQLKKLDLREAENLTSLSCGKLAFADSAIEEIYFPANIKNITLAEQAFDKSKLTDLDLSMLPRKSQLTVHKNTFKGSLIRNLSLPYRSQIKGLNRDVDISKFLGCSENMEITEHFDAQEGNALFNELLQAQEENFDDDDDDDNTRESTLNRDEIIQILTKQYPLYAELDKAQNNIAAQSNEQPVPSGNNKTERKKAKKRAKRQQAKVINSQLRHFNITARQLSKERAKKIANNVIYLDSIGWPTEGDALNNINHKVYQEREDSALKVSGGHEYHIDTFYVNERGIVFRTPEKQQGGRIIKTRYGIFFEEHHENLPDFTLCLSGHDKGKARALVIDTQRGFNTNRKFKWISGLGTLHT